MNFALRNLTILVVSALLLNASQAFAADKIETIQKAMKEECKIGVSAKKALTLIRPLYLTCVPGTKVSVDDCDVKCLKNNSGVILGR